MGQPSGFFEATFSSWKRKPVSVSIFQSANDLHALEHAFKVWIFGAPLLQSWCTEWNDEKGAERQRKLGRRKRLFSPEGLA
jgi:hypothetical protein